MGFLEVGGSHWLFPFCGWLAVCGLGLILSTLQEYSITLLNRGVTIGWVGWSVGGLGVVGKGLPRSSVVVRCGAGFVLGGWLVAVAVEPLVCFFDAFVDVLCLVALVPGDVVEGGGELFSFLGCPVG